MLQLFAWAHGDACFRHEGAEPVVWRLLKFDYSLQSPYTEGEIASRTYYLS